MADQERSADGASAARTIAAVAVLGGAVVLVVLPALVGFGLIPRPAAAGLAALAAVAGGVKFAVRAWGLTGRWLRRPGPRAVAASVD